MPAVPPLISSASRAVRRRQSLPKHVRDMLVLMVRGRPGDDENVQPLTFIEAGRAVGLKPDVARRWLDRPDALTFLRAERKAFRAAVCAANEAILAEIRASAPNSMARIAAIRMLEELENPKAGGVNVSVNVAQNNTVGYAYEPCNRPTIDAAPATPTPTIDAEPIIERPLEPTVVEYRRREAETAAEVAAERVAQHDRMNHPVFRPRGY
jgi:hypothetical protein